VTRRQAIPALVTLVVIACGFGALEAARVESWDIALRLILLAAVADGIDGALARRLRATSALGKQLDSLADIVAFGVAPAFLFSTFYADTHDAARYGVAIAFAAAGAYRLARFHGQAGNDYFFGLPITAAGALLTVVVAGPFTAGVLEGGAVAVALAVLMVSRLRFPTFADWRWTLFPGLVAATIPIALWPGVDTLAIIAAIILSLYIVLGLVNRVFPATTRRKRPLPHMSEHNVNPGIPRSNGRRSYWAFLKAFVRDRKTVGAVAPTSRGVARRIARLAEAGEVRNIAEFGPGTGAITRELLAALPPDGRLFAFEVHQPFVRHLRETITDPRFTVLSESAEAVTTICESEAEDGFDAIVSSIPFSLIGPEQTAEILRAVSRTLRPGGIFVALQYHPRYLKPLMTAEFGQVERQLYPWNIPPATLLRAVRPGSAE
jgi:CDP-diacylglycerol---serine O-phosphatidyltransferase